MSEAKPGEVLIEQTTRKSRRMHKRWEPGTWAWDTFAPRRQLRLQNGLEKRMLVRSTMKGQLGQVLSVNCIERIELHITVRKEGSHGPVKEQHAN